MSGDGPTQPAGCRPIQISPQALIEVLSVIVSSLPDRIAEWPREYLAQIHAMGLEAARAAADALSGQVQPSADSGRRL